MTSLIVRVMVDFSVGVVSVEVTDQLFAAGIAHDLVGTVKALITAFGQNVEHAHAHSPSGTTGGLCILAMAAVLSMPPADHSSICSAR